MPRRPSFLLAALLAACAAGSPEPTVPEAATAASTVDPHAGHHQGGSSHMEDMAAARAALREALGEAYDRPVPGLEDADLARGRVVYDRHCASCHGPEGKGDGPAGKDLNPPAANFTDAFHARYYSDAGRVHVIRKGAPKTAMTGFEGVLTEQEILDVYAFVRSLRPSVTP